jgi:ubiquinone/menaquinone biosynthesis C-methylase UbiE/DNA-directed RNA polymerase subunit RPC12/RpoP
LADRDMMSHTEIIAILRCPICGSDLEDLDDVLRCNGCGNKYRIINNKIIDLLVNKHGWVGFFERFPKIYDPWSRFGWRLTGQGSLKDFYSDFIEDLEEGVLIDVGCGTGTLISMLERKGFKGIIMGIDVSMPMLRVASEKTKRAVFLRASMDNIPLKDSTVDHYISSFAVHIAEDKEKVFREMKRVLKDIGNFRIAVATASSIRGKIFSLLLRVKPLDENTYINLIRSLGLEIHRVEKYGIFISIYGAKHRDGIR